MITGIVTSALEATVRIHILDANGQSQVIDAVIDTGFAGFMSLPVSVVAALGLPRVIRDWTQLIDGRVIPVEIHTATIIWNGTPRTIDVQALGTCTLIGMRLLAAYDLAVLVRDGGPVSIDTIP